MERDIFVAEEKSNGDEKDDYIWRRKQFFPARRKTGEEKEENIFGKGNMFFL